MAIRTGAAVASDSVSSAVVDEILATLGEGTFGKVVHVKDDQK